MYCACVPLSRTFVDHIYRNLRFHTLNTVLVDTVYLHDSPLTVRWLNTVIGTVTDTVYYTVYDTVYDTIPKTRKTNWTIIYKHDLNCTNIGKTL